MSQELTAQPQEGSEGQGTTQPVEAAQTGTEQGQAPQSQTFSADYVEKLRREAAGYRTKLKEFEDAQLSETDRLKKQVEELSPKATQADRYEQALQAHLDAQRKGLPAHITALLDKLDAPDQLTWIAENRESLTAPAVSTSSPANPATGRHGANTFTTSQLNDREFYLKNKDAIIAAMAEGRIVEG